MEASSSAMRVKRHRLVLAGAVLVVGLAPTTARAQQAPAPPVQAAQPARPAAASPYDVLARMAVEANFAGPLRDTLIQRLRDPKDGTICYLYLPISVAHGPPQDDGMVRYGGNGIGSISCFPAAEQAKAASAAKAPATQPAPALKR